MTAGTGSISPVGNGWYKITVALTTGNPSSSPGLRIAIRDSSGASSYTGDGSSGVYAWGLQVEAGAFPTSYIPTTSGSATRAADVLGFSSSGWYGTNNHTAIAASTVYGGNLNYGIVFEGNSIKGLTISYATSTWYELNARNISGSNKISAATSIHAAGVSNIFGVTYDTSQASFGANGTLLAPNGSAASLGAPTSFYVGSRGGSSLFINGWIQKIKYYPARVSDTQLQRLTQ